MEVQEKEWPGSTQLTLWLVLMTIRRTVGSVKKPKCFSLKMGVSIQGAKLSQRSGETAVGVREDK